MMDLRSRKVWLAAQRCVAGCAVAAAVVGCAADRGAGFADVAETVRARAGVHVHWNQNSADDTAAAAAVDRLLAHELTVDAAVQIALINNTGLQGTYEELGIAQADVVQAGLLHNPVFAASWRFPDRAPRQTDAEYSVSGNFLELLTLPLRQRMAGAALEQAKFSVAHGVLETAADVAVAFYKMQAQELIVARLRAMAEIQGTAGELAQRQFDAGTINALEMASQQLLASQAKADVGRAEMELSDDREKLNRLMGLWGTHVTWKVVGEMPAIPAGEVSLEHLEARAIEQRLDLAAKRRGVEAIGGALGLSEDFRYLATMTVGVDTEHNPSGPNVTGPTLELELPIFDQGQGRVGRLQAQYRQARQELMRMAVDIRSETRAARDRLMAQRALALLYSETLLPEQAKVLELTQLQYNAMLKGPYDLLQSKQNQFGTERASIEAVRDYWIARVELERAVGGKLADGTATEPAAATQSDTTLVTKPRPESMPSMPGMPGMPNMPGMPGMPNMPGMPGMPDMPATPNTPKPGGTP